MKTLQNISVAFFMLVTVFFLGYGVLSHIQKTYVADEIIELEDQVAQVEERSTQEKERAKTMTEKLIAAEIQSKIIEEKLKKCRNE